MADIYKKVSEIFSLDEIQRNTLELAKLEKRNSYCDYRKTTDFCMDVMRKAGFEKIERIVHKADGESAAWDCIMPQAWDLVRRSFLRITSGEMSEAERMLADTDQQILSATIWSAPTPEEGIDAELVDYDTLNPENPDVKGRFVLFTHGNGPDLSPETQRRLALAGAAGIVASDMHTLETCPDDIFWFNGQGCTGWYFVKGDPHLPVWSIPPRRAKELRAQLAKEKIMLHGELHSRIYDGEIYTVTGVIPGESEEEYALLAHLYEPFASDDAVGFAAVTEIGRILHTMQLKLKKTLRIILSMEWYGYSAYFAERGKNILAAMSFDSCAILSGGSSCAFRQSPLCNPFFTDWFFKDAMVPHCKELVWREEYGTLSDDTFASDPGSNIPTNWIFNSQPSGDIYHHNTGVYFSTVNWKFFKSFLPACAAAFAELLTSDALPDYTEHAKAAFDADCRRILGDSRYSACDRRTMLCGQYFYQTQRARSISRFAKNVSALDGMEAMLKKALDSVRDDGKKLSAIQKEAAASIVTRKVGYGICSLAKVPYAERVRCSFPPDLFALFDGKRTVLEAIRMRDGNSANYTGDEKIAELLKKLRYLEKYGYLSLKNTCISDEMRVN